MKRTISIMVGKGSQNHNSRKFKAENVNGERTCMNVSFCDESLKSVYHELFDEAQRRYNEKQTRADRRIENYYEKIRESRQEKLFHEIVVQVGNREDMASDGEYAELAKTVLTEYYENFVQRNTSLRVFSAHLHMDEATPHLHIDFVPFVTGSKRGMDTRVSLKQALASLGFKGGTRGDTEWNQWVDAEKEHLAALMEHHGIEWERKCTHKEHLSVLDYKKQERTKEVAALDAQVTEKESEVKYLDKRIQNFEDGIGDLEKLKRELDTSPKYAVPEPQGLMTAKAYKTKLVEPFVSKLKTIIRALLVKCLQAWDNFFRINHNNARLAVQVNDLHTENEQLIAENMALRAENQKYKLLRKVLGNEKTDELLLQAQNQKRSKVRDARLDKNKNER